MALYLDEIWVNASTPEAAKRMFSVFKGLAGEGTGFPEGVRLAAGPWFSNEEAKLILVLDIQDHAKTFEPFASGMAHGLIARRRLTPIVDWQRAAAFFESL